MPQLTQTELWLLDECVKGEALMVKKLGALAMQTTDTQMQQLCHSLQQNHHRRFESLAQHIEN